MSFTRIDKTVSRVKSLNDEEDEYELLHLTPAHRIELVWEVTQAAWAMRGLTDATSRLSRHVGRVVRERR